MLSELFANNILVKLLRGDAGRYDLIASMVGAKLGERLLLMGGADGRLLAALGAKTGLTGTIAAVEPDKETATRVLTEATKAGVLADAYASEDGTMPFDVNSFDIAVIPFPADEGAGLAAPLARRSACCVTADVCRSSRERASGGRRLQSSRRSSRLDSAPRGCSPSATSWCSTKA